MTISEGEPTRRTRMHSKINIATMLTDCRPGVCSEMANTNGTLHGGAVATFADFASGLPIAAIWQDHRWNYSLGVSTNINVSCHLCAH